MITAQSTPLPPNPFALPVKDLLTRLATASAEADWGFDEKIRERLRRKAPKQPPGRLAFISLRIRFGMGAAGVQQTFATHLKYAKTALGQKFDVPKILAAKKHQLRLLAGDDTHVPVIEWITFNLLEGNLNDRSVESLRNSQMLALRRNALADEGLVFAWLYPEYIRAINFKDAPALFLAGYECSLPEDDENDWPRTLCIDRNIHTNELAIEHTETTIMLSGATGLLTTAAKPRRR